MSTQENKNNAIQLEKMVKDYLENCEKKRNQFQNLETRELEVRFQTQHISKLDYDQVVKELQMNKWVSHKISGDQMLRIIAEEMQENFGDPNGNVRLKMSTIRAELVGTETIQEYCQSNNLVELLKKPEFQKQVKFTKKTNIPGINAIDFKDMQFRVAYQNEEEYPHNSTFKRIASLLHLWNGSKKIFRCMNRVRFQHPDYPIFVDLSIVKTNKKHKRRDGMTFPLPAITLHEANVFDNSPSFEIELELDNERIFAGNYNANDLIAKIRKCIRFVLSGLQGTPYPISYTERKEVLDLYMCRMFGDTWLETKRPFPFFLGPSSKTLQQENIVESSIMSSVVRITTDYTVTEKADGLRCLLYVSKKGKVYLINSNLKVIFTGTFTKDAYCFDSLLDGEFIAYGKPPTRRFLFKFLAFDIYYFGGLQTLAHVRELPFTNNLAVDDPETEQKLNTRLAFLLDFKNRFKLESVASGTNCMFQFDVKSFETNQSIFEACSAVWAKRHLYEYEVDGLIFTPKSPGVGGDAAGKTAPLGKMTWNRSFKWKPPHYNTIDFLVMVQKDKDGQDSVKHIIRDQESMMSSIVQYKVLELYCGMDVSKYIQHRNLLNDVMTDNYRGIHPDTKQDIKQKYRAVPFHPSEPYNPDAHLCFIALENEVQNKGRMKTIEGDYFDEYTIVEFSYAKDDESKEGPWKWVPLRVRFDKTQELREGKTNYGNDVSTANNNWRSIHFPVDETTITGRRKLTEVEVVDTIYYQLKDKSNLKTGGLRDFHNLYVKSKLIEGLSHYLKQTKIKDVLLIDYAVGKAGDLPKWQRSKLAFVFGLDLSTENIMDVDDGACIRYLNSRKKNSNSSLRALFLQANSGLNIRTKGDAFSSVSEKELSQYIFGNGGTTNTKYTFPYGLAKDGFHISSCQFALHYFFQNNTVLHSFLRNVAECTALNGYFVGTCFDGEKVFKFIQHLNKLESMTINRDETKIFEIVKKYSNKEFPSDENSVGLAIDVFQESIDKTFGEYLVHFGYFERLMENYGFKLVDESVLQSMGLSRASDGFDSLFQYMKVEKDKLYQQAVNMSKEEKDISFLNRYFIFQKVRELTQPTLKNLQKDIPQDPVPLKEKTKRRKLQLPKIAMADYSPIKSS